MQNVGILGAKIPQDPDPWGKKEVKTLLSPNKQIIFKKSWDPDEMRAEPTVYTSGKRHDRFNF